LKEFWFETVTFPRGKTSKAQNTADLLFNRGWRHQVGFDVKSDYVQAYSWYGRAEAAGHSEAPRRSQELSAKMTPEQLAEAKRLVSEWQQAGK
jgi:TPR repeat protein